MKDYKTNKIIDAISLEIKILEKDMIELLDELDNTDSHSLDYHYIIETTAMMNNIEGEIDGLKVALKIINNAYPE